MKLRNEILIYAIEPIMMEFQDGSTPFIGEKEENRSSWYWNNYFNFPPADRFLSNIKE